MARRGNPYRDASGRFASGPGGGKGGLAAARKASSPGALRKTAKPKATGGTLAARTSLKKSRAKLNLNDSPQQESAVTRANRKLASAIKSSRKGGLSVRGVISGKAARQVRSQAALAREKAGLAAEASAKKRGWGKDAQRDAFMRGVKKQRSDALKRFMASKQKTTPKSKGKSAQAAQKTKPIKANAASKTPSASKKGARDAGPLRLMAGARRLQSIAEKQKERLNVFGRMSDKAPGRKYGKSTEEAWRKTEKTGEILKKAAQYYADRIGQAGKSSAVPPRRTSLDKSTSKRASRAVTNVAKAKTRQTTKQKAKSLETSANALRWYAANRTATPRPIKDSTNNLRKFKRSNKK